MNIDTFFAELTTYIRANTAITVVNGWKIYYTIPDQLEKSLIINIIDGERSNETKVNKLTVEFFMSDSDYAGLAVIMESLRASINLVRGFFSSAGIQARTFCQPIVPVKPSKDKAGQVKAIGDLAHLAFTADFYLEESV